MRSSVMASLCFKLITLVGLCWGWNLLNELAYSVIQELANVAPPMPNAMRGLCFMNGRELL